jgi:hypothetical protein
MFYSHPDTQNFMRIMISDGSVCGQVMRSKAARGEGLSGDEMISGLGLESVLSRTVLRQRARAKLAHKRAVLNEQERVDDTVEVARVSSITSRTSKVHSHQIAMRMLAIADQHTCKEV